MTTVRSLGTKTQDGPWSGLQVKTTDDYIYLQQHSQHFYYVYNYILDNVIYIF